MLDVGGWTEEEDEALKRGRLKHGYAWEKIRVLVNKAGDGRTLNAVKGRNQALNLALKNSRGSLYFY